MAQETYRLIVIVGPTASGKSAFAVRLANKIGGEIISADSRQVYRGLDIGTGKITKKEMRGVRHHLLDVASPMGVFSAHDFVERGKRTVADIVSRGRVPIIVGGTGFYIDALVGRIALPDVPPHARLRTRLQKKSAHELYSLLADRDLRRAKMLASPSERNNKVRLIRALEVAASKRHSSVPLPARDPLAKQHIVWLGLMPKDLDERIGRRLHSRLAQGMIAEARNLHARGLSYCRMRQLGLEYGALADLLQKKITREEFEVRLLRDIRRYAKKQRAYWKRNAAIEWVDPGNARVLSRLEGRLMRR